MEKKDIRQYIFQQRRQMTTEELERNSQIICEEIMKQPQWREASCVFAYMDCKNEVSMRPLLEDAWKSGKKVAVPKVFGKEMKFFYIRSYEEVEPGYFGICEPVTTEEALEETALIIVPGVAFDRNRHRCGYGGGFYDRYLSQHTHHGTIAPAFDFQIVDQVPVQEFDIFPQMIITEKEII